MEKFMPSIPLILSFITELSKHIIPLNNLTALQNLKREAYFVEYHDI